MCPQGHVQLKFIGKGLPFQWLNFTACNPECKNGKLGALVGHSWVALSNTHSQGPAIRGQRLALCLVTRRTQQTRVRATTGPFVVAYVPLTAFRSACLKRSLCVAFTGGEQRNSVKGSASLSSREKHNVEREGHVEAERFHSVLS